MQIDDAEYAPTYYSILALDQTGNAARCVKPPQMQNNWSNGGGRPPPRFNARENSGAASQFSNAGGYVMFGVTDYTLTKATSRMDSPAAHMVIKESEDEETDFEDEESDGENQTDDDEGEVYLTLPRRQLQVNAADRTVPSTRAARKQTFDGDSETTIPNVVKTTPTKVTPGKIRDILEDVQPYDARQPRKVSRRNVPRAELNKTTHKIQTSKSSRRIGKEAVKRTWVEDQKFRARYTFPGIVERILDLEIPMSVREALVASKEIRTSLQDVIKVKNAESRSYWGAITLTLATRLAPERTGATTEVLYADVDRRVMAIIADDAGEETGTARNLGASSEGRASAGLDASNKLVWEQMMQEIAMLLRAWVQFVLLLGLHVATMLERGIRSDYEVRRVKKERETTHLNSFPTSALPNPPNETTNTSFMQISEHVAPVRCDSETFAEVDDLTIKHQAESQRLVSTAAALLPAVEARIQQLEASVIDDLHVRPRRGFGTMGSRPVSTAPASLDVVAATIETRDAATRNEQEVRPGQLWTGQVQRLNGNVLPGGQEVISSVFLNAEMRVQDPATGEMGAETGHAQVTFFKRPHERVQNWKMCAPYVSQRDVRRGDGAARRRRIATGARRIKEESHSPPAVLIPLITFPNLSNQRNCQLVNDNGHYLSHPVDVPPPVNAADMTKVGMSVDGRRVVLKTTNGTDGSPVRPGTPHPSTILHDQRPRILPSAPPQFSCGFFLATECRRRAIWKKTTSLRGGERQMDMEEGEVVERRGDESARSPILRPEAEMADISSDEERDQWAAGSPPANSVVGTGGSRCQSRISERRKAKSGQTLRSSSSTSTPHHPPLAFAAPLPPTTRPRLLDLTTPYRRYAQSPPVTSDEPSPSDESSAASIAQSASNESSRGGGEPPNHGWSMDETPLGGGRRPQRVGGGTRHPLFISGILRNDDDTLGTTSDSRERPPASINAPVRQSTTTSALPSAATSAEASAQLILPAGKIRLPTYERLSGVNERAAAHVYTQRCMMDESNHHIRKEAMEDQWAVAPAHDFLDVAGHGLRGELNHEAMSKVVYVNNEGLALERDRERLDRARTLTIHASACTSTPAILDSISTAEGAFMRILDAEPMMTPLQVGGGSPTSKFVDDLARARAFLLEFLDRLIALGLQRHIQQQPAVIHCLSPHPSALLKVAEFDRIRIAHAGFHSHGYHLISEVLSRVLHVQFKREELISHLLYAGYWERRFITLSNDLPRSLTAPPIPGLTIILRLLSRPFDRFPLVTNVILAENRDYLPPGVTAVTLIGGGIIQMGRSGDVVAQRDSLRPSLVVHAGDHSSNVANTTQRRNGVPRSRCLMNTGCSRTRKISTPTPSSSPCSFTRSSVFGEEASGLGGCEYDAQRITTDNRVVYNSW
ncbi:hypothetical protein R3P38DRAFT_2813950 [Favolaschia claudopus]|uniref:Uncharacterized protein n=1 Tax=Favolaschia claudopus TaxID=2862362 RepID=A0AAV9Z3W6_9AGAR